MAGTEGRRTHLTPRCQYSIRMLIEERRCAVGRNVGKVQYNLCRATCMYSRVGRPLETTWNPWSRARSSSKAGSGSRDTEATTCGSVPLSPVPSRSCSTFPLFPSLFRLSPVLPVPAPAIMTCQGLLRYDHESGLERDSETLLTVPTRLAVQWTYVLGGRSQEVIVIRKGNAV